MSLGRYLKKSLVFTAILLAVTQGSGCSIKSSLEAPSKRVSSDTASKNTTPKEVEVSFDSPVAANGFDRSLIRLKIINESGKPLKHVTPELEILNLSSDRDYLSICSETDEGGLSVCGLTSTLSGPKILRLKKPFDKDILEPIVFTHGEAKKLSISTILDTQAGAYFKVGASLLDEFDNLVNTGPDSGARVFAKLTSNEDSLGGGLFETLLLGRAEFDLRLFKAGEFKSVVFKKEPLNAIGGSEEISHISNFFNVSAAGPSSLVFLKQPSSVLYTERIETVIGVSDSYGNTLSSWSKPIEIFFNNLSSSHTISGSTLLAASNNGSYLFSNTINKGASAIYLSVKSDGLPDLLSNSFNIIGPLYGEVRSIRLLGQPQDRKSTQSQEIQLVINGY